MALDAITIEDASGNPRDVVGKYNAASQFQQGVHLLNQTVSNTQTATGAGGNVISSPDLGMSKYSIQVKQTGTVTSWTVALQVSNDGANWATIMTHTKAANLDGGIVFSGPNFYPALYARVNVTELTLGGGTNIISTLVGMP